jgi:hypothetical protein
MTIDIISRKLATLASSNAANALSQALIAYQRGASIGNFSTIAQQTIDPTLNTIMTGGYANAALGPAAYVSDALATASLAGSFPGLCAQSADGRYWRLQPLHGAISIEQIGAVPNATGSAVANVAAVKLALAYLALLGGGTLDAGPGTFWFDATSLGANGLVLPANVTLRGQRRATIWAVTDQTAAMLLSTTTNTTVQIEDIELRGRCSLSNLSGGGLRRVAFVGSLSNTVQYAETGIAVAGSFGGAGQTYNDGTTTLNGSDFVHTLSGTALTVTMTGGTLGATRQQRNVVSDYIPLDITKRYVVDFLAGFLTGAGGNQPVLRLYDANKVELTGSAPSWNDAGSPFVPNLDVQNSYSTALIYGAAYMTVQVGSFRDYSTSVGLTAVYDLSKIAIYQLVNDLAGKVLTSSPGDSGQVLFYNCKNIAVRDCNFTMIDRSCVKLVSCTGSTIAGNVTSYALQGFTDDTGVGNHIIDNHIDLRVATQGGLMIGSRAFRLRGIGGQQSQRGEYSRNTILGASWGIEVLAQNIAYRNTASDNIIEAEFCGLSLTIGTWVANNNRVTLSSSAIFGIEFPGVNGTAHNNSITWREFSGYNGFGYSCSNVVKVVLQGGFTRAPYLTQLTGSSGGDLHVNGMDGEYGVSAILGRDGPIYAHFGRIVPFSTLVFPYNATVGSAIFDIQTNSASYQVSMAADYVTVGASNLISLSGTGYMAACLPEIITQVAYVVDYYCRITCPTGWPVHHQWNRCNFINPLGSLFSNQWGLYMNLAANSSVMLRGNSWGAGSWPVPGGTYSRVYIKGDPLLTRTLTNQAVGSIAAGASWSLTGITMTGAMINDGTYDVQSTTPGGLAGLIVQAWCTADDTVTLQITNPATSARTVATQTIQITARRVA